jgi:metallo-beta-lactamase family protein
MKINSIRPNGATLFVGFQAAGTVGRRIVDGAKAVRLFGQPHPAHAKVFTIGGLSARTDQDALLGWLGGFRRRPRAIWVVHGEPVAAHTLRDAIEERLGWRAAVPAARQTVTLGSEA